jgi:hypothetical protein
MKPEIQALMRKAGLVGGEESEEGSSPLSQKLKALGYGVEETLESMVSVAQGSGNETLRYKAITDIAKMHGVLKEQVQTQMPSFTIVLNDPFATAQEAGPTVNPIFLPRQLKNKETESEPAN